MIKKTTLLLAMLMSVSGLVAAPPQTRIEANHKVTILIDRSGILTGDGVTLQTGDWKTIESPMNASPVIIKQENGSVYLWQTPRAKVVRTIKAEPNGRLTITWEVEFTPGIVDGKYIELSLTGPKNEWKNFPIAPARTIADSGGVIEIKPDVGPLFLDFSGSTGKWKFEELRNISWFGHLRLLFVTGYNQVKGTKFTAKLSVSQTRSGITQNLQGNGDEYAGVVVPPEEKNAPPVLPATFKVETQKALRQSSSRLFGYNGDWHGYEILRPVETDKVTPDAVKNPTNPELTAALAGVPTPLNRTAGTDSQCFQWQKTIGPNRERKPFPLWFNKQAGSTHHYGLVEHFSWFRQLNANSEFVFVINLFNTTPEDSRALAEFLTSGPETPLGAKRIAYGLAQPVIPVIWELGNEMDLGGPKHMEKDQYIASCRAHITAIRQACPNAVFAAHALSSPWDPKRYLNWQDWNQSVLNTLGKDLSYIAFHPYYRGMPPGSMLKFIDELRADIAASPNPAIKIFNSEHAKWPPGYESGEEIWKRNWYQTHALVGVLDTAEWMLLMLNRPEIGAQTYHSFSAGPWGIVYRDKTTQRYYTTGMAELFRFFGEPGYDNTVVYSKLSGPSTDPYILPFNFTGAAEVSRDNKHLYLTLNNRLPNSERELVLELDDPSWKPIEMRILSAPSLESCNTASARPIKTVSRQLTSGEKLRIPAKSVVRIVCIRTP